MLLYRAGMRIVLLARHVHPRAIAFTRPGVTRNS